MWWKMKNKELTIVVEGLLERVAKLEEAIRFDSHDGMTNIGITMEADPYAEARQAYKDEVLQTKQRGGWADWANYKFKPLYSFAPENYRRKPKEAKQREPVVGDLVYVWDEDPAYRSEITIVTIEEGAEYRFCNSDKDGWQNATMHPKQIELDKYKAALEKIVSTENENHLIGSNMYYHIVALAKEALK